MIGARRALLLCLFEPGFGEVRPVHLPTGQRAYKFLLDGRRWLDDPQNPRKAHDGVGGLNSTVELGITNQKN